MLGPPPRCCARAGFFSVERAAEEYERLMLGRG